MSPTCKDVPGILAKLISDSCKNKRLHSELQEIQDRIEEYTDAGLILETHD